MMKRSLAIVIVSTLLLTRPSIGLAANDRPVTQQSILDSLSRALVEKLEAQRPQLYYDLLSSTDKPQKQLNEDPDIQLMYINERGHPVYYETNNLNAAKTISTDDVWPGGSGGFSLDGAATVLGELGMWDGGGVRLTHQEFGGRVSQMDSPSGTHYHSTHVAGTMVAAGVYPNAKGMSFAGTLAAYDWNSDNSEMAAAAAAGMNVSNHSYGYATGWRYSDGDWYWWGDASVSAIEDYGFGFYSNEAHDWDEIAYNAPYYTICKSAGNDRDDSGPGAGGGHYVLVLGDWVWSTDTRDPDGGTDHYDCVSWNGTAKNIITVGAVNDIPAGYASPAGVVMSSFSGWGPTDDGRIKPDLVANGIGLYSTDHGNNFDYLTISGTSMSAPNLSGSVNLLVRHYEATHGSTTPLASTVKAVLIHTADEAGPNDGPDYMFGWGLMNTLKAARIIQEDVTRPGTILEEVLANGETDLISFVSDGIMPIRVTLSWTDPPGSPPPASLNPPALMLVNDLDLRVEHVATSTVYLPYVLNPGSPGDAATTGDNYRDNSEQVYFATPPPGECEVTVTHKGTLAAWQYYSLVLSGAGFTCVDSDGDGFGDPGHPENDCPDDNCPTVYNSDQIDVDKDGFGAACDCDDSDSHTYPGAAPNDDPSACMRDADEDGYGDIDATGDIVPGTDCDDTDAYVHPAATEVWYDGVDQDCDGMNDFDADMDGYVHEAYSAEVGGSASGTGDCDDADATIHPAATEVWYDGVDQDCNGLNDFDADMDGYVHEGYSGEVGGSASGTGDCDDTDETIHPAATEVWYDGVDQDCNGLNDFDGDTDGYVHEGYSGEVGGSALGTGDCDDADATIHPGAAEVWYDGLDQDCDGLNDFDADKDGYVHEGYSGEVGGSALGTGDCDDTDVTINSSVTEVCDGVDNDCSGGSDEPFGDTDGDGWGDACDDVCCAIRGDVDHSGVLPTDIADLVYLVDYMFNGGPVPVCGGEGDIDGSGVEPIDIADLVYLVDYMFNGGPEPPQCP